MVNRKKMADKPNKQEEKIAQIAQKVKEEIQHELLEKSKDLKHLDSVISHIENVQKSCVILSKRLMEDEENSENYNIGFKLLKNSYLHDNSKFSGIEWKYLRTADLIKEESCSSNGDRKKCFSLALEEHVNKNLHHPEYWDGVKNMPPEYLAEMVCDLRGRSMEFGTNLREWIKDVFLVKHNLSTNSKTYREMKKYIDLLLDPAFK